MTDLKKIVGVGKVKAEKIKEAGYADVEALNELEDAVLNAAPLNLKVESIDSIRALVGKSDAPQSEEVAQTGDADKDQSTSSVDQENQEASSPEGSSQEGELGNGSESPQEVELTDQKSVSDEDSADSQDQTSTPSEDGKPEDQASSPAEQPTESSAKSPDAEPESVEPQLIEFRLESGKHKNRVLLWNTANPSAQFKDGLYVSLSVLSVAKRSEQPEEGQTAFNLIYGQTTNGASLPDAEFKAFSEALAKKRPRHQRTRLG